MALADAVPFAVAAWTLDEVSGTRADSVGSSDLTDNNTVASAAGMFGNAADFLSSSSQYLSHADNADLSAGDVDFMLRCWVNLDFVDTDNYALVKYDNTTNNREFLLRLSGGKLQWFVSPDGASSVGPVETAALSATTWYLVHCWHSATDNEIGISLNAAAAATMSHSGGVLNGTAPFQVGAGIGGFYSGLIDDIVFLKGYVLSSAERTEDYNSGTGVAFADWATTGIAFDAASNSGYQTATATYNWNHTCTGSDRLLVVGIAMFSLAQTVTGITYNGVAMSLVGTKASVSGACRVELWSLVAPATGTNSIAVTLSGAISSAGCASSFTSVNQTVPTEAFNSAQATNVGAADATVDVTTVANNDWCVDIVATDDGSITVGAGQTQRANVTGALGSGTMSTEGPKTPAGAVTMSWTGVGALATWATGSVALRPVAASTQYTQSLAGSCTPTGTLTKSVTKPLAGSTTATGALAKSTSKTLTASMTATGALAKSAAKPLSGSATATGTIAKSTSKPLAGSTTTTGSLAKSASNSTTGSCTSSSIASQQTQKSLACSTTPSGSTSRSTTKTFAGSCAPTGAATSIRAALQTLGGSLTASGAATKSILKGFAGTLTCTGSMTSTGGTPATDASSVVSFSVQFVYTQDWPLQLLYVRPQAPQLSNVRAADVEFTKD